MFPDNSRMVPIQNHNKSSTLSVFPYLSAHPKKGRARRSLSKVCPHRDAQEFCKSKYFTSPSKLLRAFDRKSRSPSIPKPKGMKRCAEVGILLGFHWGTVSADFLLRGTRMWYHKSTNRRKRFISRKNVFLIVGKVPAEVVGRKPM